MRIHGLIISNFKIYIKLCPDVCNRIIVWNCSTGCRMMSMWYMLQHKCKIDKLTQFLWGFKFQSVWGFKFQSDCVSWEIKKFIVNMKLQKFRPYFPMENTQKYTISIIFPRIVRNATFNEQIAWHQSWTRSTAALKLERYHQERL